MIDAVRLQSLSIRRYTIAEMTILTIVMVIAVFVVVSSIYFAYSMFLSVPSFDIWEISVDLIKIKGGDFKVEDWFRKHYDHIILLSRAVMLADYLWADGRLIVTTVLTWLFQLTTLVVFCVWLSRRSEIWSVDWLIGAGFVVILLFSFTQGENFLHAFQLSYVMAHTFAVTSMYFVSLYQRPRFRLGMLLLAILFATLSSYSMANGLVLWFLIVGYMGIIRAPVRDMTWLLIAIGITLAGYLLAPSGLDGGPGWLGLNSWNNLLQWLEFYLVLLGNPVGIWGSSAAFGAGVLIIALGATLLVYILRKRMLDIYAMPLLVALFGLSSLAAISFGRGEVGITHALTSRYVTTAMMVWIPVLLVTLNLAPSFSRRQFGGRGVILLIAIIVASNQIPSARGQMLNILGFYLHTSALYADFGGDQQLIYHQAFPFIAQQRAGMYPDHFFREEKLAHYYEDSPYSLMGKDISKISISERDCRGKVKSIALVPGSESKMLVEGSIDRAGSEFNIRRVVLFVDASNNEVIGIGIGMWPHSDDSNGSSRVWRGYTLRTADRINVYFVGKNNQIDCFIGSAIL